MVFAKISLEVSTEIFIVPKATLTVDRYMTEIQ